MWFGLGLGMVSAWVICSSWFWKFLWKRLKTFGRWMAGQAIQETWHDTPDIKYVDTVRTIERQSKETRPVKVKEQPKAQSNQLPEDLSTLSKEEITQLLKTNDVWVAKK